jgi:hypothetical protein
MNLPFVGRLISVALILAFCQVLKAQSDYSTLGLGYQIASYNLPGFTTLLQNINSNNPGLTKPFSTDYKYSGFHVHYGFGNKRSFFTLQYARYNTSVSAEGLVVAVSSNPATYTIGSHHNFFTAQYQFFPIRFIGVGAHFGYGYSTFNDKQVDLFVGEINNTVDKKGGGVYGINAAVLIPLGSGAQFRFQPEYTIVLYNMDMDNLPKIYLGQSHQAPTATKIKGLALQFSFDIRF